MNPIMSIIRLFRHGPLHIKVVLILIILILVVAPFVYWQHHHNVKYRQTQRLMRSLATAIESYAVDAAYYPAWAVGERGLHAHLPSHHPAVNLPTFRMPSIVVSASDSSRTHPTPFMLTTPYAYILEFPADPYADQSRGLVSFIYFCSPYENAPQRGFGWILISPGPDGDYDINPISHYDATLMPAQQVEIISRAYDPTNGMFSDGDVIRVKQ